MAVTDPDVPVYQGTSMFLVPTDTPGIEIIRNVGLARRAADDEGTHAYVRYNQVRVPADNVLGGEGQAFAIAQTRLGGGRIHHAMRTVGVCQKAFDMMCERALSRRDAGRGAREEADGAGEDRRLLHPARSGFRLHGAPRRVADRPEGRRSKARTEIAAVKVLTPKVLHDIVYRALHIHGSLGHVERDAAHGHVVDDAGDGDRRRPDRGAQGHDRPEGAQASTDRPRVCSRARTCHLVWRRRVRSSQTCSSTRWHSIEPDPRHRRGEHAGLGRHRRGGPHRRARRRRRTGHVDGRPGTAGRG